MSFTIAHWNHGYKKMVQKCVQHIMKGKSVATERFTRTLKNKIYKYVTLISENVCIDK